jgi:hypothetical protein
MKKKKPVDKPVPFMNKNLKRAIYKAQATIKVLYILTES